MTAAPPHRLAFKAEIPAEAAAGAAGCSQSCSLRLLDPVALSHADQANWDQLGEARSGDNIFAEPWLMRLSLAHFDPFAAVRLAVVEDVQGRWLGALPLVRRSRLGRLIWPHWAGWDHPNQFNNTPLVRAGYEATFWRTLFAGLDCQPGWAISLCLSDLPADDPVNCVLVEVCQSDQRNWNAYRRFSRASLRIDGGVQQRLEAAFRPKHRRRIDSLERQLEAEHGAVQLRRTRDPEEVAGLIDQFLELEAAGWKGSAGSALDQAAETRNFFRATALAAAERGKFEVSWLEVNDHAIDMTTQFVGSQWSSGFKRAHDERYSRFAPGQLHLRHLTRRLIAEGGGNFDSCASPDQESINRMWPDRRELFDCHVAIGGPLRSLACSGLSRARQAFHWAKRIG